MHPALQGLKGFEGNDRILVTKKERLAQLAAKYGLSTVIRWKPKKVNLQRIQGARALLLTLIAKMTNLQGSGLSIVLNQALYAIVGAVALQRGGEVANAVIKDRVFNPLGFR